MIDSMAGEREKLFGFNTKFSLQDWTAQSQNRLVHCQTVATEISTTMESILLAITSSTMMKECHGQFDIPVSDFF
jgi:hypothetical protein